MGRPQTDHDWLAPWLGWLTQVEQRHGALDIDNERLMDALHAQWKTGVSAASATLET